MIFKRVYVNKSKYGTTLEDKYIKHVKIDKL
jgi:hypothetical protein